MSDLAGTGSIEYYLKGRALRQQKEETEARTAIAQQQAELKAQQLNDAWKINEIKLKEAERFHNAQIAKMKADFEIASQNSQGQLAKLVADGILEADAKNPGRFIPTEAGRRAIILANEAKLKAQAQADVDVAKQTNLIPVKGATAGAEAQARIPAQSVLEGIKHDFRGQEREDTQAFTAEQNALNRAAQRANTLTRAESVYSNKAAKQEEKNEVNAQMTEDYLPDILSGAPEGVLEALPKGEAGLKLRNSVKAQGYSILTRKQAEHLEGMKRLQGFHDKAEKLRALIADGTAKNFSEIRQLQDELAGDLVIFGREAKAEKGVVTDKDIDRLRASIPQMFPGGAAGLFADKNKANKRRVDDIKKSYHEKVRGILGGKLKLDQKRAIYDRYQLIPDIPEHLERVE